ncbi:iron-containing alcohol dehydrogenase [Brevibacillus sp. B_LB10_24]|uniref:iron-containing alcohol dehydrogenase n=1 Tax=Brevibacillus sp. B_LB10_24 TaxID=3380645 RepID=UPI0038B902CF
MMIIQHLNFSAWMPTQVVFGVNAVREQLPTEVLKTRCKKPIIVTDQGLVNSGIVGPILNNLTEHGIRPVIFAEVEPNPVAATVQKGSELFSHEQCDLIIAIGGGSAMDVAKALAVAVTHPGDILDYRRGGKDIQGPVPSIFAIPTTAGTGSEVTTVAVITDPVQKRKFVVSSPLLAPKIAFVDPVMTYSLPPHHVAATGMDALVHAIEAYTSNRAHPIGDSLALEAMRMLREYLPVSYADPTNHEAKAQVMLASTMAGFAFMHSGLSLVHSMSHPMSAWFHVPHGLANAILLPYVIEFNLIAQVEKYRRIHSIFNESSYRFTKYEAAKKLIEELRSFSQSLDIPNDFGYLQHDIDDQVLSGLAEDAMDDRTVRNNPRKPTKEDILALYKKVFPQYQKR